MIKIKYKTNNALIATAIVILTTLFQICIFAPFIVWILSNILVHLHIAPKVAGYDECFFAGLFLLVLKYFFKDGYK